MTPELFRKLPDDVIRYVSEFMTEVKYRNGRYMGQLQLTDAFRHMGDLQRNSLNFHMMLSKHKYFDFMSNLVSVPGGPEIRIVKVRYEPDNIVDKYILYTVHKICQDESRPWLTTTEETDYLQK